MHEIDLSKGAVLEKGCVYIAEISEYLNTIVVYCKLGFVILVCLSTLIIFLVLLMINLDSKVDYILEWNYFLILLLFYLMSSIMWKKKN